MKGMLLTPEGLKRVGRRIKVSVACVVTDGDETLFAINSAAEPEGESIDDIRIFQETMTVFGALCHLLYRRFMQPQARSSSPPSERSLPQ